jgi:hypothetical protein
MLTLCALRVADWSLCTRFPPSWPIGALLFVGGEEMVVDGRVSRLEVVFGGSRI